MDEVEPWHRNELARELSQPEVDFIVARVDGTRDQVARLDAQQQRLDQAGLDRDGNALYVTPKPDVVVAAHRERQREQVMLIRGGGEATRNDTDRDTRPDVA